MRVFWVSMRWLTLIALAGVGLAGCGSRQDSPVGNAEEASLLDEATVNAILGANIPPEDLPHANVTADNAVSENVSEPPGNRTDDGRGRP